MTRKQHYMTEHERYQLEALALAKVPVSQIADQLGFTRQTIYNELRRGSYTRVVVRGGYYFDELQYSADKGQQVFLHNQRFKGRPLKIGHDHAFAEFLESRILLDRYSPAAALAAARASGFRTSICVSTLYSYISRGVFLRLCDSDLLEKPFRKPRQKSTGLKVAHETLPNISQRPEAINSRDSFGHWEMDLVVGPSGSHPVLLTLTERSSRYEMIFKLPNKKARSTRMVFNRLERQLPNFKDIFKSITTDNGPEFLEYEKLRRSIHGGKRFDLYYCHSYAAWEKGTNENHNRMIRRFFPKGTDFSKVSRDQIAAVQSWLNNYPRRILSWHCPSDFWPNAPDTA